MDTIGATPAPRAGRDLAGRPSIAWFFAAAVLMGAPMCFMLMTVWAPASSAVYLFAGFIGACGVALAVLLAREFRGLATGYLAAADRRDFLGRLDAEARWFGHRLDPPAGSTPTVPSVARVVLAPAAARGPWWVVHVTFDGDLAVLTGPRYFVRRLTWNLR
ncbi:MAG: hypothetical protein JNM10_15120 [Planctomycetia bacterium]|nr:hypothetical protein [Planctomycetia bacterium]